jgi:hypothetical protein
MHKVPLPKRVWRGGRMCLDSTTILSRVGESQSKWKMGADDLFRWRTFEHARRRSKRLIYQELPEDQAFITAQIGGNEVFSPRFSHSAA